MQDKIYQKLISGEEAYKYTYEELYKEIEDYGYNNTQYITDFFWGLSEDKYYLKSDRLLFFDQKTKKKYSLIYSEYYNMLKKFIDNGHLNFMNTTIENNILVSDILTGFTYITRNIVLYKDNKVCIDEGSFVDALYTIDNKLYISDEYKEYIKSSNHAGIEFNKDMAKLKEYGLSLCD